MSESSREQHLRAAQQALALGDAEAACGHLRDVLENEFEPRIASAISRIEAGEPVALDELMDTSATFDDVADSGIDADLFGMELVVEEVSPDAIDAAVAELPEVDDHSVMGDPLADVDFEERSAGAAPRMPSKVRYRGVAPPPPVHRSRSSDSWLAHDDTIAPGEADTPDSPEPDDLDDWDFGGASGASASTAKVERQQIGFDELTGAMQPSGHLPGMRDAFVEPEVDDGSLSALPAELVSEPSEYAADPASVPPQSGADTRPPTTGGGHTLWDPPGAEPSGQLADTGAYDVAPDVLSEPDPFDAFAESRLAGLLDAGDVLPAPADAGAAATFDVRMQSRPRQQVVPERDPLSTRPGEAVSEDQRPTRPATEPLRWEPDHARAEVVEPGRAPEPPNARAGRTGRTLSGWRGGEHRLVPDVPTPTADPVETPEPEPPASPAGPSAAQIEATRAAFARQSSFDRRTSQGRSGTTTGHGQNDRSPEALSRGLMEVSDFFIVGELDKAEACLDALDARWPDNAEVAGFHNEIRKAREQRLVNLVEPVHRVPMANAHADAAALAALNPRRMFIVSLADGMATIEDLIDMSGMPPNEARVAIGSLIDLGVLVFDA